jgi:hypothetical protein
MCEADVSMFRVPIKPLASLDLSPENVGGILKKGSTGHPEEGRDNLQPNMSDANFFFALFTPVMLSNAIGPLPYEQKFPIEASFE